jgi:hypothetical protein
LTEVAGQALIPSDFISPVKRVLAREPLGRTSEEIAPQFICSEMASPLLRVPRDIYTRDVDFTALALQYPDFAKRLKTNKQLDFSDPESVRQLTKALLRRDFNLSIELPEDRLCPPVPNRFNYVLWIQDLLGSTSDDFQEKYDPTREVVGLDMSVGFITPLSS